MHVKCLGSYQVVRFSHFHLYQDLAGIPLHNNSVSWLEESAKECLGWLHFVWLTVLTSGVSFNRFVSCPAEATYSGIWLRRKGMKLRVENGLLVNIYRWNFHEGLFIFIVQMCVGEFFLLCLNFFPCSYRIQASDLMQQLNFLSYIGCCWLVNLVFSKLRF